MNVLRPLSDESFKVRLLSLSADGNGCAAGVVLHSCLTLVCFIDVINIFSLSAVLRFCSPHTRDGSPVSSETPSSIINV